VQASDVHHRLGALPMRHQGALLHQSGRQVTAAALATATALHAAVDRQGQRRARRHQGLAGQCHQGARPDSSHRARRPVQAVVVVFLFSTFQFSEKKKTK